MSFGAVGMKHSDVLRDSDFDKTPVKERQTM
jgi:hypothetical protein